MAALRHTARTTFGDLVPEALHDKLMDSGFFDHDGNGVEVKDFFNQSEEDQSDDRDFLDEDEGKEQSAEQDFFEEPDEEPGDQAFFDEPEHEVRGRRGRRRRAARR